MAKVKLCGIRDLAAAQAVIAAGADYLGFNFVPESKRFIQPQDALSIIDAIRGQVAVVGVFRDAPLVAVTKVARELGLDFVQLHGEETAAYARQVGVPVIKAVAVDPDSDAAVLAAEVRQYSPGTIFLLDRHTQGVGEPVGHKLAAELASQFPCFLAGGLAPNTVADAVRSVRPYGVDVAGGVEREGRTDPELVQLFIRQVKRSKS